MWSFEKPSNIRVIKYQWKNLEEKLCPKLSQLLETVCVCVCVYV